MAVGRPFPTSSACVGPHRTATRALGISSSMISVRVLSVFSSMPLATETMSCPSVTKGAMLLAVLLVNGEGTARTRTSFPRIASPRSVVARTVFGRIVPGSLTLCSWKVLIMSTSSCAMDQIVRSCRFPDSSYVRAVPQEPAPIIPIFAILYDSFPFFLS